MSDQAYEIFSLCNFLHPLSLPALLDPNNLLSENLYPVVQRRTPANLVVCGPRGLGGPKK